jgi:hypothetical protein
MLVDSFKATAQNRRHTFRLERDFKVLLLRRVSQLGVAGSLADGCPERVSCILTDHSGNRLDMVNRIQLGAMAFYKQLGEGAIYEEYNGANPADEHYTSYLPMVLTGDAGIHITGEDQFNFELDDAIIGAYYELHLFETPFFGANFLEYTAVTNLSGSKRKSLDVDALVGLVIPTEAPIDRIILRYGHGGTRETSLDELRQLNGEMNDVEARLKTLASGGSITNIFGSEESQYVFLDCGNVVHVDFDSDGSQFEITQIGVKAR